MDPDTFESPPVNSDGFKKHLFMRVAILIFLLLAIASGVYAAYSFLRKSPVQESIQDEGRESVLTYNQILGITPAPKTSFSVDPNFVIDPSLSRYISLRESTVDSRKRFYGEITDKGKTFATLELLGQKENLSEVNLTVNLYASEPDSTIIFFALSVMKNLDPDPQNRDSVNWFQDTLDQIVDDKTAEVIKRTFEGNFNNKKITLSFTGNPQSESDETIVVKIVPNPDAKERYVGKYQKIYADAIAHHATMIVDFQPIKMTASNVDGREMRYVLSLQNIPTDIKSYLIQIDLRDKSGYGLIGGNVIIGRQGDKWQIEKGYEAGVTIVKNTTTQLTIEANYNYKLNSPGIAEDFHQLSIKVDDKDSPYNYLKIYNQKFKF